jgi:hypothetical protein
MTVMIPLCFDCVHYFEKNNNVHECKAFPEGIPKNILLKGHDKVIKGQVGDYTFKRK